jgi:outer membrane protein OmpA-like peptidoglycan-associated protein
MDAEAMLLARSPFVVPAHAAPRCGVDVPDLEGPFVFSGPGEAEASSPPAIAGELVRQPDFRISGFPEYEDSVGKLPDEQQKIIDRIAQRIVDSQSEFTPIVAFVITGHADKDLRTDNPHRKRGETPAQFEMRISGARASRAREALVRKIRALSLGKSTDILNQLQTDRRRSRIVAMGATDLLHPSPTNESERRLNRRVEIFLFSGLVPDPDPVPPPIPKPDAADLPKRLARCAELLEKKNMPSGRVQTQRMQCIVRKLKDNPAVNDLFIDSHDGQPVRINGKPQDGLQNVNLSYGKVSDAELEQFVDHAKAVVLNDPDLAPTASDEEAIRAMDRLDRRMLKAIAFLHSHLERSGIAADPAKLKLNDRIHRLQNDRDSIYSCR